MPRSFGIGQQFELLFCKCFVAFISSSQTAKIWAVHIYGPVLSLYLGGDIWTRTQGFKASVLQALPQP